MRSSWSSRTSSSTRIWSYGRIADGGFRIERSPTPIRNPQSQIRNPLGPPLAPFEQGAELGRHLYTEDLPPRGAHDDRVRSGRALAPRRTGLTGLPGWARGCIGAPAVARVRRTLTAPAALASRSAWSSGSARPAGGAGAHDPGKERVVDRRDDGKAASPATRAPWAPVAATPAWGPGLRRTSGGPGRAIGPDRARHAAAAPPAARLDHQPIGRRHRCRVLQHVERRRQTYLDARHEQLVVERRAQNREADGCVGTVTRRLAGPAGLTGEHE